MQSSAEPGVDADEETRRRQREELMYWNTLHLEKKQKERSASERRFSASSRTNFDDFLKADPSGEKGTYIYNTGADVHQGSSQNLVLRRGEGARGIGSTLFANPFTDDHTFEADTQRAIDASLMSPEPSEKCEVTSEDLYEASVDARISRQTTATLAEQLIDTSEDPVPDPPVSCPTMEDLMQSNPTPKNVGPTDDAFASIHAWADNSTDPSFYTPLPATPAVASPRQEQATLSAEVFDDPPISLPGSGEATPTDSISLAGSGEEIWYPRSGATSEADVMSIEGISTLGSWTEVGSEVSEHDIDMQHA